MTDCIFCRIVAREAPAAVVMESESAIAFMDIGSVNPGHVLVATKTHVESVLQLDSQLAARTFELATRVAKAINEAFFPQGISIYQANGRAAGQTVFHFHLHVVPRHEGDGMELLWPTKNPSRAELDLAAARIRQLL